MYASASLASLKSSHTTAITIAVPRIVLTTNPRNNRPTGAISFHLNREKSPFGIKRIVDESYRLMIASFAGSKVSQANIAKEVTLGLVLSKPYMTPKLQEHYPRVACVNHEEFSASKDEAGRGKGGLKPF